MTDDTKEALARMERLLSLDGVSLHAAIHAAYQLGVMDGQIQMASVGQRLVEELGIPGDRSE